ncbi:MAG TPA: cytochrome c oxidase assembly protein, partial [Longimicrobiales bacterium]|nr:cytochrome c oxidase assembly protein [Longimicrobiales bacterium]
EPPLLLLGIPGETYRALASGGAVTSSLRTLTHPLIALILFGAVLGASHWPPVVDTLMVSQLGSFVLDLAWLAAGTVFWWPVVAPVPERPRFGYPAKMGYLFLGTIVNTAPFLFLTFSRFPVYAIYELAPPVPWLGTRDDQVVAGLLMKMGGAAILWTGITILFARWYRSQEDLFGEAAPNAAAGERGPAA